MFIVGPISVEVHGAVQSLLEDSPAPSCRGLVAENVKLSLAGGIDGVQSTDCVTGFAILDAVWG